MTQNTRTYISPLEGCRYFIRHNGAIIYFIADEGEEFQVTLNANGTCGCQHNGVQECSAGCHHVEAAKILELFEQEQVQKYQAQKEAAAARRECAPLNGNKGFSLLR